MPIRTSDYAIPRRQLLAQAMQALASATCAAFLAACGPSGALETSAALTSTPAESVAPTANVSVASTSTPSTETPAPAASRTTAAVTATSVSSVPTSSTPTAAVTAAKSCPSGDVCNAALGVAVTLPPGWQEAPPGKYPPGDLALQIPASSGQVDNDLRLQISPWGTTMDTDEAQAASAGMDRLLQGVSPPPARTAVQYGGATGLLVHEPQIPPKGVTAIVLAHAGTVLKILAPGKALAADQRQALESLRFVPRAGPFPPSN